MNLHGQCVTEIKTRIAVGNESLAEQINTALNNCMNQVESLNVELIISIGISTPELSTRRKRLFLFKLLETDEFQPEKTNLRVFPERSRQNR